MKKAIWILKWYILDSSDYTIKDVKVYVFDNVEDAKTYLKKMAYKIYVDNEGDEVKFEDWELGIYDSYDYEIYSDSIK